MAVAGLDLPVFDFPDFPDFSALLVLPAFAFDPGLALSALAPLALGASSPGLPLAGLAVFAVPALVADAPAAGVRVAKVVVLVDVPPRAVLARPPVVVPVRAVRARPPVVLPVDLAGVAARVLAASLSEVTAVSSALVALVIAVSALLMAFAEAVACAVAVFSRDAAFVTLVAAAETVRGVTAVARAEVLVLADEVFAAVRVAVAGPLAVEVFVAVALRPEAGFVAAVLVGTDLPPIWTSYGGLIPRTCRFTPVPHQNRRLKACSPVSEVYCSPSGTSPATIRSASSGEAPLPTATPIR